MTKCEKLFKNLKDWHNNQRHPRIETDRHMAKAIIDTLTQNQNRHFDPESSENFGYAVEKFDEGWISCLGNRFEVNFHKGGTYNIWIKES